MLKLIKNQIALITYTIFSKLNKLYIRGHELSLQKKCVIGGGTRLYDTSSVENLQDDPAKIIIGENTHIRGNLLIYPYGNGLTIGNNCYVGENSIIRAASEINIGNNVLIAHNVTIIDTDSHELNYLARSQSYESMLKNGHPKSPGDVKSSPIKIKDYAWISYNVAILKGVTIGKGAIIGAGSVVTKNIPDFCIAAGNPAQIIRQNNH